MTISRPLRIRGAVFAILGLAGFVVLSVNPVFRVAGVVVACVCFFLAGTALSSASQIAMALRPVVGKFVRVEVRGIALPAPGEAPFQVVSISAFGAGLLIRLAPASGGPRRLLKVAQPGPATVGDDRIEIRGAAYVSWAGAKLGPGTGDGAPTLVLLVAGQVRGVSPA